MAEMALQARTGEIAHFATRAVGIVGLGLSAATWAWWVSERVLSFGITLALASLVLGGALLILSKWRALAVAGVFSLGLIAYETSQAHEYEFQLQRVENAYFANDTYVQLWPLVTKVVHGFERPDAFSPGAHREALKKAVVALGVLVDEHEKALADDQVGLGLLYAQAPSSAVRKRYLHLDDTTGVYQPRSIFFVRQDVLRIRAYAERVLALSEGNSTVTLAVGGKYVLANASLKKEFDEQRAFLSATYQTFRVTKSNYIDHKVHRRPQR